MMPWCVSSSGKTYQRPGADRRTGGTRAFSTGDDKPGRGAPPFRTETHAAGAGAMPFGRPGTKSLPATRKVSYVAEGNMQGGPP